MHLLANQVARIESRDVFQPIRLSNRVTWRLLDNQDAQIKSRDAFRPIRLLESSHLTPFGQSGCSNQVTWRLSANQVARINSLEVSSGQLIDVQLSLEGWPRRDDDQGYDDRYAEGYGHRYDLPAAAVVGHGCFVAQYGDGT